MAIDDANNNHYDITLSHACDAPTTKINFEMCTQDLPLKFIIQISLLLSLDFIVSSTTASV